MADISTALVTRGYQEKGGTSFPRHVRRTKEWYSTQELFQCPIHVAVTRNYSRQRENQWPDQWSFKTTGCSKQLVTKGQKISRLIMLGAYQAGKKGAVFFVGTKLGA